MGKKKKKKNLSHSPVLPVISAHPEQKFQGHLAARQSGSRVERRKRKLVEAGETCVPGAATGNGRRKRGVEVEASL